MPGAGGGFPGAGEGRGLPSVGSTGPGGGRGLPGAGSTSPGGGRGLPGAGSSGPGSSGPGGGRGLPGAESNGPGGGRGLPSAGSIGGGGLPGARMLGAGSDGADADSRPVSSGGESSPSSIRVVFDSVYSRNCRKILAFRVLKLGKRFTAFVSSLSHNSRIQPNEENCSCIVVLYLLCADCAHACISAKCARAHFQV